MIAVRSGEDAHDVGTPADVFVEPFLGIVGPDWRQTLLGERGERRQHIARGIEVFNDLGNLSAGASITRLY
jgi:hypothetical protein